MIITLFSDFGYQDYSSGIAKGILLEVLPEAHLVDISHDIFPNHLLQCSYFLKSIVSLFPKNTIHLSLFDMFGKIPSRPLLTMVDGRFVISADNGLLPLSFGEQLGSVYQIKGSCSNFFEWIREVSLFIKQWHQRGYPLDDLKQTTVFKQPYSLESYATEDSITCQVIHIDRFGNVVLNLSKAFFEKNRRGRNFRISFSRNNEITRLCNHYSDVPEGEQLCLFNIGGFMEIAVNKGSAAQLFGFSLMLEKQLIYQKIKIDFL